MNLVLLLVHLFLTSYAPTATTTDDGNTTNTGTTEPGKDKGGKTQNGDYIISNDIMP